MEEALNDLQSLDKTQKVQVVKAIKKVSTNPLSKSEGGYGNPLGNRGGINLTGLYKIKLLKLGIRVVYKLEKTETEMLIIVVGMRSDEEVYKEADKRISK
ncbi:MAG: type II toxin-antitoxin system RelE/ParE family toxin [Pseudobutyrivibrio ruminis]|uniref:Type II toxin-antitoxin system RelE/ParE family toxin n=1 Tax=Pseudobutyrivibrio ruminis TaxID=46206 RepID=A0A927UC33_9FIRM|nr:type II toxin-antitoxin system RelE/ParE family toxin [Pseudobutyrivibrio ruminis]